MDDITIGIAETKEEFRQIHKLNYVTFVEEIGQHNANTSKSLVDAFNDENVYYIVKKNDDLIGMIALRDQRPFSLDKKIAHLNSILPKHKNIVEIRLLSVKKEYRNTKVFLSLIQAVIQDKPEDSYDLAIISAIPSQKKLYRHIGFQDMGPMVGDKIKFQPMYLTKQRFLQFAQAIRNKNKLVLNLLPGPVEIAKNVKEAFSLDPISHRSTLFKTKFKSVKEKLLNLCSANYVEILTGTGTTANDAIAGQLSLLDQKGIILSNGEFGERLFRHGNNFDLDYIPFKKKWAETYSIEEIEKEIINGNINWLWFVHCETSTGMLNPFEAISNLCQTHNIKMCVDVISSIGLQKLDLSNVYLASASSSKGLASYSGLAIVFYNHNLDKQVLPSNINLNLFQESDGIPFTISSNLVMALDQALLNISNIDIRVNRIKKVSTKLRQMLEEKGVKILVNENCSSNSVFTIILNQDINSVAFGDKLKDKNIFISYESEYLIKNNWIQVCLMGATPKLRNTKRIVDFF